MYNLPVGMSSRPADLLIETPTSRRESRKGGSVVLDIFESGECMREMMKG